MLLSPPSQREWNCMSTWNLPSCSLGPHRKGIRRQLAGGWAVVRFPTESKSQRERERHACLFLWECPLQSCVCALWLVRHSQPGPRLCATQHALERCGREWVWDFWWCGRAAADPSHPSAVTPSMQGRRPWVSARLRGSAIVQSGGSLVLSESVTAALSWLCLCLWFA